jgi:hypothetical protein
MRSMAKELAPKTRPSGEVGTAIGLDDEHEIPTDGERSDAQARAATRCAVWNRDPSMPTPSLKDVDGLDLASRENEAGRRQGEVAVVEGLKALGGLLPKPPDELLGAFVDALVDLVAETFATVISGWVHDLKTAAQFVQRREAESRVSLERIR